MRANPAHTATVHEHLEMSYAELHDYAARIATQLEQLNLQAGQSVGLCLSRSHHAIAAMLGSWMAGGAFVPLDPEYPSERLRYMIEDAEIQVIISSAQHVQLFAADPCEILLLDERSPQTLAPAAQRWLDEPAANELAYIMYTSGSTGKPKGVPIEHGALLNYCHADAAVYQLTATDRTLQFSTINFDIAIEEIFPPLITGGAVVIRPAERIDAQIELSALVDKYKVSALHLATGYWHEWVDLMVAARVQTPASLRLMVVTGEKVSATHYRRWREIESNTTLWANAYGPTETTVTATVFIPPAGWQEENLPIGKAIKGYSAHILDQHRQAVAAGETGELYIGGASLARGYLNRPDLTQESFVTVETSAGRKERLYRTGDLARWLPSGDIAYAGRIDHQMKVGSYRIEPGEIEAAINDYPGTLESLLVADTSGPQKALLAYIACDPLSFELSALYGYLQKKLPPHMVPLKYILLPVFPKTVNGKIDRRALPDGSSAITATQQHFESAQSATEESLAALWAEQLALAQVGRLDNFFGLGGDSLLAARMLGAIQRQMGTALSARDFFANPELHQLAACIDSYPAQTQATEMQRLQAPFADTPLAASQLRLWLQYESAQRNLSMFHVHEAVRITGPLDTARLIESLQQVVARHSALQMNVLSRDGSPVMHWAEDFQLPVLQSTLAADTNAEAFVEDCADKERFALATSPLVRAHIARCADGAQLLVLVAHHLVVDGWSMSVLLREIAAHYAGDSLPAQPWQFVEFARADSAARDANHYSPQLDYWQGQLSGLEPVEFSQDFKAPATRQFSSAQVAFNLSPAISQQLETTAKELNSSAHALLMACYFLLLSRHTRSKDFAVATAVHGRNSAQLENIVGSFIGTLPIRGKIQRSMNFRELVQQLRDTTRDAISNSDVHFDEIVRRLDPVRVDDQLPFSPFMFLFQNIPDAELKLKGLQCEHLVAPINASEYNLLLEVSVLERDGSDSYQARIVYSDELYERASIESFSEQFTRLLEHALDAPEDPIATLDLLSETDRHTLIHALNPPRTAYDQSQNFVQLIWQQAAQSPNKIAVRDDAGMALSYSELCSKAEQLAIYLQQLGAGPGSLIALSVNRSAQMLIALLGIMRSGSAYLPLDPSYPAERVRYILEDARAPVLITEQALRDTLPNSQAKIIELDADWQSVVDATADKSLDSAAAAVTMDDLAYVIYTSGSTGNPKGVQLKHRNALNFLLSMQTMPGFDRSDKLLAVTTLSFDISVLELYLPLLSGAELVVASRKLAIDGKHMAAYLEAQQITVLQATPATWRLLLEAGWQGNRRIKGLIGGEALPADILPRLLPMLGSLWNMYGPTETAVWSSCEQITDAHASVSIGKPIANTQVYILDEHLQLCPLGAPGELCIAGDGVSQGYSNRPDLNTSQFLPDPFSDSAGAKLYRTGDLARWRNDGKLSYISRLDNLVKLNGFRIELGEIETVLAAHAGIKQAAVLIREDTPGAKRLVAYWVSQGGDNTGPDEALLQQHLSESLPAYMVPQQFVQLESLPQTPNGKLDRKALPEPPQRTAEQQQGSIDTPLQAEIAEQWQQLLGVTSIGCNDKFFSLGGHSLSAIKFINWAERNHSSNVPMRILIMGTLGQVAAHIDPASASSADMSKVSSDGLAEITAEFVECNAAQLYCTHVKCAEPATSALLIVSSHGYEQSRIDRSYRTLAQELATQGVHCLLVDLSGTGNSSLNSRSVDTLQQWQNDIRCAAEMLLERSGCQTLSVLGGRFSASLLSSAQLDGIALDKVFLWDPVIDGAQWWQQRLNLQQKASNSWYYFLKPRCTVDPQGLQSPGLNINPALRAEIDAFKFDGDALDTRFHVIQSSGACEHGFGAAQRLQTGTAIDWYDTHKSTSTDIDSFEMRQYIRATMTTGAT